GIELIDQFEAALVILVVRVCDEVVARHQVGELLPIGLGETVNPDFAIGTGIDVAGTGGRVTVAQAADLKPVLDHADGAIDGGHADVKHCDLNLASFPGASPLKESSQYARGQMHAGAGINQRGSHADTRSVAITSHTDDAGGRLYREIQRTEL